MNPDLVKRGIEVSGRMSADRKNQTPQTHTQNPHNPAQQQSAAGDSGDFGDAIQDWRNQQPIPLGRQPDPLPTDALGPELGNLARSIGEGYQVPTDLVVNLALPNITTAAAGQWEVQVTPDWTETLALATVTALASGERKSPVNNLLSRALRDYERAVQREAQPRIAEAQAKRRIAEDRAELLRKVAVKSGDSVDAAAYVEACRALTETSIEPLPRWLCDDATPEAIDGLLGEHGAIGVISSEPGLFAILGGRYSNGSPNVENVLKATSGDPIRIDRADKNKDPICVDRPALSIACCMQPGRLVELGRTPVFRSSGLLARILFGLPQPRVGTRSISPQPVPAEHVEAWSQRIHALASEAAKHRESGHNPRTISVEDDAMRLLNDYRQRIEPALHPHYGKLAGIADWGSKLPGTVVRIAAALTLFTDPHKLSISTDVMASAIRLGTAYISHAIAAFGMIHAATDDLEHAREVLGWLRRRAETDSGDFGDRSAVSLRDVWQGMRGRSWVESVDNLRSAFAVLTDRGHVRKLPDDREPGQAGRPSEKFELHPVHLPKNPETARLPSRMNEGWELDPSNPSHPPGDTAPGESPCCKTGPAGNSCQLCPQSPTYWRNAS